jgi:hypothetical protein
MAERKVGIERFRQPKGASAAIKQSIANTVGTTNMTHGPNSEAALKKQKNQKHYIVKGATLVACSLIHNVVKAVLAEQLSKLDSYCHERNSEEVTNLWRELVDALECAKKLANIIAGIDSSSCDGTEVISIKLQNISITLKILELGEFIYYLRGNDFSIDHAHVDVNFRRQRTNKFFPEKGEDCWRTTVRYVLAISLEERLHRVKLLFDSSSLDIIREYIEDFDISAYTEAFEQMKHLDPHGNAKSDPNKQKVVKTPSSHHSSSSNQKDTVASKQQHPHSFAISNDRDMPVSSPVARGTIAFGDNSPRSHVEPRDNDNHHSLGDHSITNYLGNVFNNSKDYFGCSQDGECILRLARVCHPWKVLRTVLTCLSNQIYQSSNTENIIDLLTKGVIESFNEDGLFLWSIPFSLKKAHKPSNLSLSWLECALMIKHKSDSLETALKPPDVDEEDMDEEDMDEEKIFKDHSSFSYKPNKQESIKAIKDELLEIEDALKSSEQTCRLRKNRLSKITSVLRDHLNTLENKSIKTSNNDMNPDLLSCLFENHKFPMLVFAIESPGHTSMWLRTSNVHLFVEKFKTAKLDTVDCHGYATIQLLMKNMLCNGIAYSSELGFVLPIMKTPMEYLRQVYEINLIYLLNIGYNNLILLLFVLCRCLEEAYQDLVNKIARTLHKILLDNNLLQQADAEWIPNVIELLKPPQPLQTPNAAGGEHHKLPAEREHNVISLDAQSMLKAKKLSNMFKMDTNQLVQYALNCLEKNTAELREDC